MHIEQVEVVEGGEGRGEEGEEKGMERRWTKEKKEKIGREKGKLGNRALSKLMLGKNGVGKNKI
jgi:hypothetical protein